MFLLVATQQTPNSNIFSLWHTPASIDLANRALWLFWWVVGRRNGRVVVGSRPDAARYISAISASLANMLVGVVIEFGFHSVGSYTIVAHAVAETISLDTNVEAVDRHTRVTDFDSLHGRTLVIGETEIFRAGRSLGATDIGNTGANQYPVAAFETLGIRVVY